MKQGKLQTVDNSVDMCKRHKKDIALVCLKLHNSVGR